MSMDRHQRRLTDLQAALRTLDKIPSNYDRARGGAVGCAHALEDLNSLIQLSQILQRNTELRGELDLLFQRASDSAASKAIDKIINDKLHPFLTPESPEALLLPEDMDEPLANQNSFRVMMAFTRKSGRNDQQTVAAQYLRDFRQEVPSCIAIVDTDPDHPYGKARLLQLGLQFAMWAIKRWPLSNNKNEALAIPVVELGSAGKEVVALLGESRNQADAAFATIRRFRAYCEWFVPSRAREAIERAVDDYKKRKSENPSLQRKFRSERYVHEFLNEWLFREGFIPLVNFQMGDSEPDTLSLPGPESLQASRPMVVEVKQALHPESEAEDGKQHKSELNEALINKGVEQTVAYLRKVNALGWDVPYGSLVIFYDDQRPFSRVEPFLVVVEGYEILVELVYIGSGYISDSRGAFKWKGI